MSGVLAVSLLAFGFGFVGSMPLAGPISILIVSRSAERKYRQALSISLGGALAEGPYAGLAFFGFTTFLARHAWVLPASHAVTGVLLSALGIYFSRWRSTGTATREDPRTGGFLLGLSIAALNPTLLATWSAVTAALYSHFPDRMEAWMAIPFGLAAGLGIQAWNSLLIALMRHFGERFPHRVLTWGVRGMGLVLLVLGVVAGIRFVQFFAHHHG